MEVNGSGLSQNDSALDPFEDEPHILDNAYVRVTFILLYTVIFLLCFFGNLTVVLVVTLHWKMRSITKFCLGNLAFANLCVGIFCIYQNLTTYLLDSWLFGDFMCKMYHFTNSLCHTASILILVLVSIERYIVLIHPFKCRQILTIQRLVFIIVGVWVLSAGISSPRLYYFGTIRIPLSDTESGIICVPKKKMYNSATADSIYFIVLYLLPLSIISVMYSRIAIYLRRSARLQADYDESTSSTLLGNSASVSNSTGAHAQAERNALLVSMKEPRRGAHECLENEPFSSLISTTSTSGFMYTLPSRSGGKKDGVNLLVVKPPRPYRIVWKSASRTQESRNRTKASTDQTRAGSSSNSCDHSRRTLSGGLIEGMEEDLEDIQRARSTTPTLVSQARQANPCQPLARKCAADWERATTCCCESENTTTGTSPSPARYHRSRIRLSRIRCNQRHSAVRMLILIVITFALLNLPFHVRKLCLHYWSSYDTGGDTTNLIAPLTFLLMYANCAINPIFYAFMSQHFRASLRDLIYCDRGRSNRTKAVFFS